MLLDGRWSRDRTGERGGRDERDLYLGREGSYNKGQQVIIPGGQCREKGVRLDTEHWSHAARMVKPIFIPRHQGYSQDPISSFSVILNI